MIYYGGASRHESRYYCGSAETVHLGGKGEPFGNGMSTVEIEVEIQDEGGAIVDPLPY